MKSRPKWTNERTSEYDISVAFPFSAVTICKPQQKWANQSSCSGMRVTNTKHCACICIRFNPDTFSTARSPNYDTTTIIEGTEKMLSHISEQMSFLFTRPCDLCECSESCCDSESASIEEIDETKECITP
jgi:hypothetical protein